MTDFDRAFLSELIDRLRFSLAAPIDFRRTDTEATLVKVRLLTAAATYFNILAVSDFGGRSEPEREAGLVEQVVAAAFQTFGGTDQHPGPFDKAAMLLRGIAQGHPFNDGNKRTGFLVASYYLRRVGLPLGTGVSGTEVVHLCVRISAGEIRDVQAIADELRRLWDASRYRSVDTVTERQS